MGRREATPKTQGCFVDECRVSRTSKLQRSCESRNFDLRNSWPATGEADANELKAVAVGTSTSSQPPARGKKGTASLAIDRWLAA